jgi:hypothetical protein
MAATKRSRFSRLRVCFLICFSSLASSLPSVNSTSPLGVAALESRLGAAAACPVTCSPFVPQAGGDPLQSRGMFICDTVRSATAPRVTIFATLFGVSDAMVSAWLADILRQTIVHDVELLVSVIENEYSKTIIDTLGASLCAASTSGVPALQSVRVIWWPADPGLYQTWSFAVLHVAHPASYRSNWNPDDRRAKFALSRQAALLDSKPHVDLVAGPVKKLSRDPLNETWGTAQDCRVLQLVSFARGKLPRALTLADFGRVVKHQFQVTNPPHNAPMFRKRVTDVAGGAFDADADPLSDWALWVKAIQRGCIYWFMESPLVVWYHGPRQYSATHAEQRAVAVDHVLKQDCGVWKEAMGREVCNLVALQREAAMQSLMTESSS